MGKLFSACFLAPPVWFSSLQATTNPGIAKQECREVAVNNNCMVEERNSAIHPFH